MLIRKLKPRYRIGLLSNTNEWHFDHAVRACTRLSHFDAVSVSYQVKAMKPSAPIYLDALGKLGTDPEETLFIDDRAENVEGDARRDAGPHLRIARSVARIIGPAQHHSRIIKRNRHAYAYTRPGTHSGRRKQTQNYR